MRSAAPVGGLFFSRLNLAAHGHLSADFCAQDHARVAIRRLSTSVIPTMYPVRGVRS